MNSWMSRTKPLRYEYLEASMGHKGKRGNISKEAFVNLTVYCFLVLDISHNSNQFWEFCHFQKLFVKAKLMQT